MARGKTGINCLKENRGVRWNAGDPDNTFVVKQDPPLRTVRRGGGDRC